MRNKGFTLIELVVVVAIIAILSGVILFSTTQYINRGKDSSISGNLAILVPAGEAYYNSNLSGGFNSYSGFCSSNVVKNASTQIPKPQDNLDCSTGSTPGICCTVNSANDAWAACAQKFADSSLAFCVDSRGVKKDISNDACENDALTECQ